MKKIFLTKILLMMITVIMLTMLCVSTVSAASYDTQILKKGEENYILYIEELLNEKFEFTFLNDDTSYDLSTYYDSGLDTANGNSIAYIDSEIYDTYFEGKENTYISVKQNDVCLIEKAKVILEEALTESQISEINNLTKEIDVEVGTKVTEYTENDVAIKITKGTMSITDTEDAQYSYVIKKITEGSEEEKLMMILNKLNELEDKSITEKLDIYNEIKIMNENMQPADNDESWVNIENKIIESPEGTKSGDKYLIWLKQDGKSGINKDIQIMTALNEEDQVLEKEKVVTVHTTKLPVTGDSLILIIVGAVLVIAIVIVIVMKKKESKKDNEK